MKSYMENWATSDIHFGHDNIIDYCNRPFHNTFNEDLSLWETRVEEMNRQLIENWNETVAPNDTVWVLGDGAMGKLKLTVPLFKKCHGKKKLLPGNHDACWFGGKKNHASWVELYEAAGFEIVGNSVEDGGGIIRLDDYFDGKRVDACHFPFSGDSGANDDRYLTWRPADHGQFLLHGHTHNPERVNPDNPRAIHVGTDAWNYRPVNFSVLHDLMNQAA
jgi:calcineurin-like phosphoesterase family protein